MFKVQQIQYTADWPVWVDVGPAFPSLYWAKVWIAEHARNPRRYRIVSA